MLSHSLKRNTLTKNYIKESLNNDSQIPQTPKSTSTIINTDYTPSEQDNVILINGKCIINLPSIDGKCFIIKDITGKKNIAKVQCDGKIDNEDYIMIGEFESYSLICKIDDSFGESKTNYYIL